MIKLDVQLDEMPKSCQDCRMCIGGPYEYFCIFYWLVKEIEDEIDEEYMVEDEWAEVPSDKRLKACPIVEISDKEVNE